MNSFANVFEKPLKLKELFNKILEITPEQCGTQRRSYHLHEKGDKVKINNYRLISLSFKPKQNIYENKVLKIKSVYEVWIGKDPYFQS